MHQKTLTPRRILALILRMTAIVLSAEILVMLLFNQLHIETHLTEIQEAVADSLLLLLISAYPALIWVIRPIFQAAQASSQHTEMLAAALENAGESVIITDADCIIVHVNKAFEGTTGYSYEQVVGHNPNMLQSGMQSSAFYEKMWDSLNNKGEWKGELWNRRKDGALYPEVLHIRSIRDMHHQVQYYIGTFSDISERLELEKAARQNQKMEALGILVGGVAHNFNNILSGILGKTYLAKKRTSSDKVRDQLDDIHQLGMEGSELIKQLLAFTQDGTHEKQKIPIDTLLKASLKSSQLSGLENIQLQSNFPDHEVFVSGDGGELQQVFINIVANAIDAVKNSSEKSITISLEELLCKACPTYGSCGGCAAHCAKLTVTDSGCGIAEADLEHIFDPFFSTKDNGTGLGLSMANGAIKSHKGSIHAESTPDQGTSITVCLPLYIPKSEAAGEDNYTI